VEHKINFLDITIHTESNSLSIEIYRKPTYTDSIFLNNSCHPREHKLAAIHYLYNRINNSQLPPDKIQKEENLIQQILHNNGHNTPIWKTTYSDNKHKPNIEKTQWTKFTYMGKETTAITKVFKNTKIMVTYSTNNTLRKLLTKKHQPHKNKYENSGIYQITWPTCNMKYTGQTGRSFSTRFQEHLRDFNGTGKSRFAQHLLENGHAISPIEEIMDTIHFTNTGRLMNTLEKFYIFHETKSNNQINDKLTVKPNIIFDTIVQQDPHRGIPNAHSTQ
jgi:hypothetical protein